MSFNLDISDDFASITDWLKPVVIDGVDVERSLRRAIGTREAANSGGKYLSSDTAFHLDAAEHPSRPTIGGQITDTDGIWTVLSVAKQTLANRWRCVARQLWIDPSLTVTIQKATYAKGTTGAAEPTWAAVAEDVVAKIHIESAKVDNGNMNRSETQAASVYFATPQTLGPGYRIIGSGGQTLKVLTWEGFDELEFLFKATCEVSKWPHA